VCIAAVGGTECLDAGASYFRADAFSGERALGPGQHMSIGVSFTPDSAREFEERLLFLVDDDVAPYTTDMRGTGVDDVSLSGGGCRAAAGGSGVGAGLGASLALLALAFGIRRRRR
jgi:hypothetical protein